MTLIISLISSFEINNVNFFPPLAALFPVIFCSSWFIVSEAKLLTNPDEISVAKGMTRSVIFFT